MRETPADVERLQQLITNSIAQAGPFLRRSLQMPDHSLSARQVIRYFEGLQTVAFATVTARNEPRVAPIGAILFRGQFYIPTVATAVRANHVRQRPGSSMTHFLGNDLAVIVHGQAAVVTPEHDAFAELESIQRAFSGDSVQDWGEGVYLQIEADVLYTFARYPSSYPE